MKRIIKIVVCFLICFCNIEVFASTNTFERTAENNYLVNSDIEINDYNLQLILQTPAVDATEKIYDFADLYTDSEEEWLYSLVEDYIDSYKLDFAIVTINENPKISTEDYAQDFYDYNDFGFNTQHDGILFLIDMQNREFYMVTTGEGINMYTDYRINECLDAAFSYIAGGDYYDGTKAFIEKADSYASIGAPDEYGNEPRPTGLARLEGSWSSIIIFSVIATAIVMYIFISKNKLVRQANSSKHYLTNANTYMVKEIFLGKNVHRSARSHDSGGSSSGGSSGRSISSGSSGRSHGGGGRRF